MVSRDGRSVRRGRPECGAIRSGLPRVVTFRDVNPVAANRAGIDMRPQFERMVGRSITVRCSWLRSGLSILRVKAVSTGARLARQALCVEAQRLVTVPRSEAPSFSAVRTCQQTVADSILAIRSSSMPVAIGDRPDAWNAVRSRRTLPKAFLRYRSRSLALVGQIDESTHSLILDGASAGQVASPDRVARSLMA